MSKKPSQPKSSPKANKPLTPDSPVSEETHKRTTSDTPIAQETSKSSALDVVIAKIGLTGAIITAFVGVVGTIAVAYLGYLGVMGPVWANQTAEARLTAAALAASPTPTLTSTPQPTASITPTPPPTPSPTNTSSPTPTPTDVWFVSVPDDQQQMRLLDATAAIEVEQTVTLIGGYPAHVAEAIWVFVITPGRLTYPQSPNACVGEGTPKVDGRWEMRVGVGSAADNGQFFKIVVTVANDEANQFIVDTLIRWCKSGNYEGLRELPSGIVVQREFIVRRNEVRWGRAPQISAHPITNTVSITNLSDGDGVPATLTLEGSYFEDAYAEEANNIWVLVYPPNGRWYPQSKAACLGVHTEKENGRWTVPANFGGDQNIGQPFGVVVVLADAEANAFFNSKQEEWCKAGNSPGFLTIELPPGIVEADWVTVYRQ
jgi:hypothetical protein